MATRARQAASRSEIVLIGPPAAGKSTLARRLSECFGKPVVSVDACTSALLAHLGMSLDKAESLYAEGRIIEWMQYRRPFEHLALLTVLQSYRDCIFDTGAGHVIGCDVVANGQQVEIDLPHALLRALQRHKWIVHVHPTSALGMDDEATSRRRLLRRLQRAHESNPAHVAQSVAEYFVARRKSYERLASFSIQTGITNSRTTARALIEKLTS